MDVDQTGVPSILKILQVNTAVPFLFFLQTVVSNLFRTQKKVQCQQSIIPVHEEILDIPNFTEDDHKQLIKTLPRGIYF